jgi:hypothetical protein
MSRPIEADDWDAWSALFDFARSAFRLETLQTYTEPDEAPAVARFLAGEDPSLDTTWWEAMLRRHRDAGRTISRVRVLVEPLSDYARFQLPYFSRFAKAGEDISIIATSPGSWPADVPSHDYWLFDDRDVWAMRYTDVGTFVRAELLDDPSDITTHRRGRDAALAHAIPLRDYLATHARQRAS